jgi:type II secretion system protein G
MIKEKFKKSIRGFTLIELLIVIAIIGVLATLLMVNFIGVRQRARDAQRKSDLRQIQSALEIYRSDNGSYPSGTSSVSELFVCPPLPSPAACTGTANCFGNPSCSTVYMHTLPKDPSSNGNYYYNNPSGGSTYTLGACLENLADSQKDNPNISTYGCNGTTNTSFTLTNP